MKLTACCVLRAQDRDLLRSSGCFDAQVCSTRSPYVSQIGVRQRFGFILEQQRQITGLGLLPEQVQSKSSPSDRIHLLPVLERVARPTPAKPPFLTITARNHDAEICWPVRTNTSSRSRGTVQTTPSGTGSDRICLITGNTVSANRAGGPCRTFARNASTPPAR